MLAMGFPRVKKFRWAQIDRIVFDKEEVLLFELWNGAYERLPKVGDGDKIVDSSNGSRSAVAGRSHVSTAEGTRSLKASHPRYLVA